MKSTTEEVPMEANSNKSIEWNLALKSAHFHWKFEDNTINT